MKLGPYDIDESTLTDVCGRWNVHRLAVSALSPLDEVTDDELYVLYEFLPDAEVGWEVFDLEAEVTEALGGRETHIVNPRWLSSSLRRDAAVRHAVVCMRLQGWSRPPTTGNGVPGS